MTFPIFYWSGGGAVYDEMNVFSSIFTILILAVLLTVCAIGAASTNILHSERVDAGLLGVTNFVGIVVIVLFGFAPTILVLGSILIGCMVVNMFSSAFGHPLW